MNQYVLKIIVKCAIKNILNKMNAYNVKKDFIYLKINVLVNVQMQQFRMVSIVNPL